MNDRSFRKRSRIIRLLLVICMVLLVGRLAFIQVAQAGSLTKDAQGWIHSEVPLNGTRGTIYDRNGTKLAFTGVAYNINIDLDKFRAKDAVKNGDTPEAYAKFLAPLVGATPEELLPYMDYSNPKKLGTGIGPKGQRVSSDVNDKIQAMHDQDKFKGITTIRTDIRDYPNGDFASHVLGFYGLDGKTNEDKGLSGVEAYYNDQLQGKPGTESLYTDREGNPIPTYKPVVEVPPIDGKDVVLTIDATIQHYVEDELDHIVDQFAPKHATIIVEDPNTGEILALGNRPSFDPNKYQKTSDPRALWDDWALSSFEPGSTFKIYTLTAALTENKLNLNDTYKSGVVYVNGIPVKDWNNGQGWGTITYRQAVYNSSNVGFVYIGQKVGKEDLFKFIDDFHFNHKTGIDLPGEQSSQLFDPKTMRDIDLASTSFGQGVSVTPIQQVAAMSAVANGGKVMWPHVVKEFRDEKTGQTVQEVKPKVLSEVSNPETLSTVRQVMEDTITQETNKIGYIKGYHVAGKTGTAQVVGADGKYDDTKYRLSYISYAPANHPRVLVYVDVDQPSKNSPLQYGDIQAEPSGRTVMDETLRYLQVPIDLNDGKDSKQSQAADESRNTPPVPQTFVSVPDFIGATKDQVQTLADKSSLKVQTVGDGPKVTGQWPDMTYGQVPEGTEIELYFGPEGSKDGKVKMPDLRGKSMREAMETLSLLNLQMAPTGDGYVTKQDIPAGTMVPFNKTVKLTLNPQS